MRPKTRLPAALVLVFPALAAAQGQAPCGGPTCPSGEAGEVTRGAGAAILAGCGPGTY